MKKTAILLIVCHMCLLHDARGKDRQIRDAVKTFFGRAPEAVLPTPPNGPIGERTGPPIKPKTPSPVIPTQDLRYLKEPILPHIPHLNSPVSTTSTKPPGGDPHHLVPSAPAVRPVFTANAKARPALTISIPKILPASSDICASPLPIGPDFEIHSVSSSNGEEKPYGNVKATETTLIHPQRLDFMESNIEQSTFLPFSILATSKDKIEKVTPPASVTRPAPGSSPVSRTASLSGSVVSTSSSAPDRDGVKKRESSQQAVVPSSPTTPVLTPPIPPSIGPGNNLNLIGQFPVPPTSTSKANKDAVQMISSFSAPKVVPLSTVVPPKSPATKDSSGKRKREDTADASSTEPIAKRQKLDTSPVSTVTVKTTADPIGILWKVQSDTSIHSSSPSSSIGQNSPSPSLSDSSTSIHSPNGDSPEKKDSQHTATLSPVTRNGDDARREAAFVSTTPMLPSIGPSTSTNTANGDTAKMISSFSTPNAVPSSSVTPPTSSVSHGTKEPKPTIAELTKEHFSQRIGSQSAPQRAGSFDSSLNPLGVRPTKKDAPKNDPKDAPRDALKRQSTLPNSFPADHTPPTKETLQKSIESTTIMGKTVISTPETPTPTLNGQFSETHELPLKSEPEPTSGINEAVNQPNKGWLPAIPALSALPAGLSKFFTGWTAHLAPTMPDLRNQIV